MMVVKRRCGFERDGYVAEATVQVADGGHVTVREYGHTVFGATARVASAVRAKMTSRRRQTGFGRDGYRTSDRRADFQFGFATA